MSSVRRVMVAVAVMSAVVSAGVADVVETLDGRSLAGTVTGIDKDALTVATEPGHQSLPHKDIGEVFFQGADGGNEAPAVDIANTPGRMVVRTIADDWIACDSLILAEGTLTLSTPLLGETAMDMKAARIILMPVDGETPQQVLADCQRYRIQPGSRDVLAIERPDGKWISADGVLLGMTKDKVAFRYRGEDRTVSRASVRAIWLAELATEQAKPAGVLVGFKGCRLHFKTVTLQAKTATVETLFAGKISIPRDKLASLRFFSDRLVNLADLEPTSVSEYGTLDTTFPHRRDQAASGGPIRLDGRTYRRGLGLHSFCELTYTLDGKYAALIATAGIDDAARPAGLAMLKILGDGKALAIETEGKEHEALELSGNASARPIRVDVSGVKTFTIRVEFGPDDLDVGDHVDLAAARLVK